MFEPDRHQLCLKGRDGTLFASAHINPIFSSEFHYVTEAGDFPNIGKHTKIDFEDGDVFIPASARIGNDCHIAASLPEDAQIGDGVCISTDRLPKGCRIPSHFSVCKLQSEKETSYIFAMSKNARNPKLYRLNEKNPYWEELNAQEKLTGRRFLVNERNTALVECDANGNADISVPALRDPQSLYFKNPETSADSRLIR